MSRTQIYRRAAQAGLFARAVVYTLLAVLALDAVFGVGGSGNPDPTTAFRTLEKAPAGQMALAVLGAGLITYALWRLIQAFMDAEDEGRDAAGLISRLGMLTSGVSHFLLGVSAFAILATAGAGDSPGGGDTQAAARFLLQQPLGRFALALAGLALAGSGAAQIWRAWTLQYEEAMRAAPTVRRFRPVTRFGVGGRGLIFILIGGFIVLAALEADASEAKGLAGTLGWLRQQPYGEAFYILAGLALLGYAVYSVVEALYRRITPPDSVTKS